MYIFFENLFLSNLYIYMIIYSFLRPIRISLLIILTLNCWVIILSPEASWIQFEKNNYFNKSKIHIFHYTLYISLTYYFHIINKIFHDKISKYFPWHYKCIFLFYFHFFIHKLIIDCDVSIYFYVHLFFIFNSSRWQDDRVR